MRLPLSPERGCCSYLEAAVVGYGQQTRATLAVGKMCCVRVWRFDPERDVAPSSAAPSDLEGRRSVLVAAPTEASASVAWIAIDDYDEAEGALLFGAPAGDEFRGFVRALLTAALAEASALGFTSLLAHWRAGWSAAEPILVELGFMQTAPGIWRRSLST